MPQCEPVFFRGVECISAVASSIGTAMKGVSGPPPAMEREGLRPSLDRCGNELRGYLGCSDANRQVQHLLDGGCNNGEGVVTTTVARRVTIPLGIEDLRGNFLVPGPE